MLLYTKCDSIKKLCKIVVTLNKLIIRTKYNFYNDKKIKNSTKRLTLKITFVNNADI